MPTPAGDVTGVGVGALPHTIKVLASAARTADPVATTDEGFGTPRGSNALSVVVVCTASAATPSVVVNIEGYDPASATWVTLLASAAITGAGTTQLQVYPGSVVTANVAADKVLPDRVRIRPVHADADSITYSIGATFSVA